MPLYGEPAPAGQLDFHLPILVRSAGLLRMLLQDGVVDLDLASSIIALDPGLAYQVLQLANRNLPDDRDRIWQLPPAIVTVGRRAIGELLDRSVQIDFNDGRSVVHGLVREAVLRACVAHSLARELASSSPRKCFLSGLLFELPALVTLSAPEQLDTHPALLSDMCHSLPVTIVRAALAQVGSQDGPTDPIVAIVLIAQKLLHADRREDARVALEELAARSLWRPWGSTPNLQRVKILQRCGQLVRWAGDSLYDVHPWEFMTQLERFTL